MDKISIITPVYNTQKYLRRCIESILLQSYSNIELLLIDDGSTDESGLICDEYATKDPRVKVFHTSNGGPSKARNLGLENVTGDYILFVDSDDWVDENFVSHYMCDNYQAYDAIFGMWDIQTNKGVYNPSMLDKPYIGDDFAKAVIDLSGKYSFELNCNKMLRTEIVKKHHIRFIEGIHSNEDDIFTYDYAKYITKFIVLPEAHYHEVYLDEFDRHLSARILPIETIYITNKMAVNSALKISDNPLWIEYQNERLFYRLASSIMKNIANNVHNISLCEFKKYIKEAHMMRIKYNKHIVNKHRENYKIWSILYDVVFAFENVLYVRFCSKLVCLVKNKLY
jgi:glycosyltransferase involved in cell wall biosynthesis